MAYDKVVDSAFLEAGLTLVGDSIRAKGGTSAKLEFPNGMKAAVEAIDTSENLDEVLTEQDSIIDQIQSALEGKAAGSVETCSVVITSSVVGASNIWAFCYSNGGYYLSDISDVTVETKTEYNPGYGEEVTTYIYTVSNVVRSSIMAISTSAYMNEYSGVSVLNDTWSNPLLFSVTVENGGTATIGFSA